MRSILLCGVAASIVFAAAGKSTGQIKTASAAGAEIIPTSAETPNLDTEGTDNAELEAEADIAPATEIDTSGAPQQIVPDVDMTNPAVDSDPRAGTTVAQNRIDFNDPTLTGQQAVEKALAAQSKAD